MLIVSEDNSIFLTRGDNAEIEITLTKDGQTYDYSNDDVKFGMKRSAFDTDCVLEKEIVDGKLVLTEDDTKDLEFGDYLYDVELRTEVEGEEQVYTPIAAAKFSIGYNVL